MDKKKLSSVLKITGFWLALGTLLMFFVPSISIKYEDYTLRQVSLYEYIFKTGYAKQLEIHYNAVYIVAFVLMLLALIAMGYVLVTNLIGKANVKLNKGLIIGSIVCLLATAVFAFCAKTVLIGEYYAAGVAPETIEFMKQNTHLYAGSIVPALFCILGGGSLIGSLVLDK